MLQANSVLVVSGEPGLREHLQRHLPDHWEVENCPDNESALALVRQRPFELVVTAQTASAREDIELLRQIRQARPHTKVIILARNTTPADVIQALREHAFAYLSAPCSTSTILEWVDAAIGSPSWDDGIEVLSARPGWVSVRARCQLETAERLQLFFREMKIQLPASVREELGTAFREILLNAIEHGGGLDESKFVEIHCARTRRAIVYSVRDPGKGFSFDSLPQSAISNPEDDPIRHLKVRSEKGLRTGGFGLLMARKFVDEMIYNEQGNEVVLIKYIAEEPDPTAANCN